VIAALLAIAVFVALALVVVRWSEVDYERHERLTTRSTIGAWLLYLFHADTVATASYAGALEVRVLPSVVALAAGIIVGALGLALFLAATTRLARATDSDEAQLATTGPYALMRHPQNIGWGLVLMGIAFAGRSVLALLLVGLFGVFVRRYTDVEERHMASRFGDRWQRYQPRWGP